jgi:hypothetical protein
MTMTASTDVPVTITPETSARIAELGKRAALEEMIAFLRRMPPPLAAIRVQLEPAYDSDEETILITTVERDSTRDPEVRREPWWDWVTATFPLAEMEMLSMAIDFKGAEEV